MSEEKTFKRKTFPANRTIFDEGDVADTVYVLSSGAVEIRVGTLSDHPRTLTVIKVGDVFGEMAIVAPPVGLDSASSNDSLASSCASSRITSWMVLVPNSPSTQLSVPLAD